MPNLNLKVCVALSISLWLMSAEGKSETHAQNNSEQAELPVPLPPEEDVVASADPGCKDQFTLNYFEVEADSNRYVKREGDTMTGPLNVQVVPTFRNIARFGQDHEGAFRSLVEIRSAKLLHESGNDIGRGALRLFDRISDRSMELGFYDYGAGLFTEGLFEMFSKGLSVRQLGTGTAEGSFLAVRDREDLRDIRLRHDGTNGILETTGNTPGGIVLSASDAIRLQIHGKDFLSLDAAGRLAGPTRIDIQEHLGFLNPTNIGSIGFSKVGGRSWLIGTSPSDATGDLFKIYDVLAARDRVVIDDKGNLRGPVSLTISDYLRIENETTIGRILMQRQGGRLWQIGASGADPTGEDFHITDVTSGLLRLAIDGAGHLSGPASMTVQGVLRSEATDRLGRLELAKSGGYTWEIGPQEGDASGGTLVIMDRTAGIPRLRLNQQGELAATGPVTTESFFRTGNLSTIGTVEFVIPETRVWRIGGLPGDSRGEKFSISDASGGEGFLVINSSGTVQVGGPLLAPDFRTGSEANIGRIQLVKSGKQVWQIGASGSDQTGEAFYITDVTAGSERLKINQEGTITLGGRVIDAKGIQHLTEGPQPSCDERSRGLTWFKPAAPGEKDSFVLCAKDAQDTYAWRDLY